MRTASAQHRTEHDRPTGATALGREGAGRPARHRRHVAGDALRAVRVFAESAFSVVVLGDYDGRPHDTPPTGTGERPTEPGDHSTEPGERLKETGEQH